MEENHTVNEGSSFISLEIVRFGDTTSEAQLTVVLQQLAGTATGTFSKTIGGVYFLLDSLLEMFVCCGV